MGREVQIDRFTHRQVGIWTREGVNKRWSKRMSK